MATNASLLKTEIKYGTASVLASELVLERVPAIFNGDWKLFRGWRRKLAALLEVDPCDVIFTGSAAVGLSLNPTKGMSLFNHDSDVDVAVISPFHFDTAWRVLRQKKSSQVSEQEWSYIEEHKNYYIFEGCIALDRVMHLMPFGVPWKSALQGMADEEPTQDRDIKIRLYRDNDSLRLYQSFGIEKLQIAINKGQA